MEIIFPGHQEMLYKDFFLPGELVVKHFTNTPNPTLLPTSMYMTAGTAPSVLSWNFPGFELALVRRQAKAGRMQLHLVSQETQLLQLKIPSLSFANCSLENCHPHESISFSFFVVSYQPIHLL